MSGISVSVNSPHSSKKGSSHERISSSCAFSNNVFLFRRIIPTHLLGYACLPESFWCNFCHAFAIGHEHVVFLFTDHHGRTIPPVGYECCSRIGFVSRDLSPDAKPDRRSQCPVCEHLLEHQQATHVSIVHECPWFRRHVEQPTTMTFVDRT